MLAALEFRNLTPTAAFFFVSVERVVRGDARQRYLDHFLIELTLIDYSVSRHLPSQSCVLGSDHFQLILQLSLCPGCRQVRSLSQKCYGNGYLGQAETPRREAWFGFVFPRWCCATSQCRSHLHSGLASGLEEAGFLSVGWYAWENIRRGIHGSTSEHREGLSAVVPVSHEYLGATASDLGSVGECAN